MTLPISREKIKIIFAIDEKSSFLSMNLNNFLSGVASAGASLATHFPRARAGAPLPRRHGPAYVYANNKKNLNLNYLVMQFWHDVMIALINIQFYLNNIF